MKTFFSFSGLLDRKSYLLVWLIDTALIVGAIIVANNIGRGGGSDFVRFFSGVVMVVAYISLVAAGAKRCRDLRKNPYWMLLLFVFPIAPLAAPIALGWDDGIVAEGRFRSAADRDYTRTG